jgi:hypothetical protein
MKRHSLLIGDNITYILYAHLLNCIRQLMKEQSLAQLAAHEVIVNLSLSVVCYNQIRWATNQEDECTPPCTDSCTCQLHVSRTRCTMRMHFQSLRISKHLCSS